ncbi:MAG: glycerol-3-phosphate acyltransferase, partial [Thermoleophilia bacterium]
FIIAFVILWIVLIAGRFVTVASLSAAVTLSVAVIVTGQPAAYIVFTILGTAVIFYAHRSNLKRLIKGKENRVAFPWNRKQ